MRLAFVMINTEAGSEGEVLKEIRKIEHVREAYLTYGVCGLLAKIEAETTDKLEVISSKVRRLSNIRSTPTTTEKFCRLYIKMILGKETERHLAKKIG